MVARRSFSELLAGLAGRVEQARLRRELTAVAGRRVTRCWRARGDFGAGSFERLTLALDDGCCLEVYSTALDACGLRAGLTQLRRQDFRSPMPAGLHSSLASDPPGPEGLRGKIITRCRLDTDDRGDLLELCPEGGPPVTIRAVAGSRPGGLALRLRAAHGWE